MEVELVEFDINVLLKPNHGLCCGTHDQREAEVAKDENIGKEARSKWEI